MGVPVFTSVTLLALLLGAGTALSGHVFEGMAIAICTIFLLLMYVTKQVTHPSWCLATPPEQGLPPVLGHAAVLYAKTMRNPKDDLGLDYEDVVLTGRESRDTPRTWTLQRMAVAGQAYRLYGWIVPAPEARSLRTCIVAVHGGGRDRRAFLRHCPFFHSLGCSVLLFDCRGHGNSDGRGRGLGYATKEAEDVMMAARFMKDTRRFERLVLVGTSQGASSCIVAAAALDVGPRRYIDGVVAENPFASRRDLIVPLLDKALGWAPPGFQWAKLRFATAVSWLVGRHVGADEAWLPEPMQCIHKVAPRPLLLLHGRKDSMIEEWHSHLLFDRAREPKALYVGEAAEHTAVYDAHKEEWEARVRKLVLAVEEEARHSHEARAATLPTTIRVPAKQAAGAT